MLQRVPLHPPPTQKEEEVEEEREEEGEEEEEEAQKLSPASLFSPPLSSVLSLSHSLFLPLAL